ncbi:DUF1571 domain-containing protein [Botrimarina sp.]|uniref:DUF1571 domain-containing protein n=1 Tax=Botrimarina sp. TaxID=2795802 RepID=UPI0032EA90DF
MPIFDRLSPPRVIAAAGLACTILALSAQGARAQQLTHPIYRVAASPAATSPVEQAVANEPPARTATAGSARTDTSVQPASTQSPANPPFDLEARPGEHPLMPCLRLAKAALAEMDQRVQDYSATFTKRERLDGELGDSQTIKIRVRHQPFSVYMQFVQPNPGQEALYVANQNNGKLVAMGSGWKRRFGKINLDPDGAMAMKDQRYPITKAGIKNLTAELIEIAEQDIKYAECEVNYAPSKIDGRPCTMIEAVHPVPRSNFRFHKAQIFIDNELRLPVAYRAYSWPQEPGGKPVLEEQYIYTDIQLNNGFTDADFSPENPALFQ